MNDGAAGSLKILIAEDERLSRLKLERQLQKWGHEVVAAEDGAQAWELFQAQPFPIVICDWEMPEMNGLDLVEKIRQTNTGSYVYIVMLTGKSDKKDVVAGIEAGADDFVSKPFDRSELHARLNAGVRIISLEQSLASTNDRLRHELAVARELSNVEYRRHEEALLGESIPVRGLREGIEANAALLTPLMLTGAIGAGQEAVARAIHRASERADRPFIHVDCGQISGSDGTLLGRYAETDDAISKWSLADGGTLFLERMETLPEETQRSLEKVVQRTTSGRDNEGSDSPDVRLIAYVSGEPVEHVRNGTLDAGLHRVMDGRLTVPSLAERGEDVVLIARHIATERAQSVGKPIEGLSDEAEQKLLQYGWPGNLRELRGVVERAVVLSQDALLEIPDELLSEGRRIGSYQLEKRLGEGAMGEVWLGTHSLLARPAAVKVIREDALNVPAEQRELLRARFQREAKATALLRSPHTVELYDFGVTDDGSFYYVMEYLAGLDLHTLVQRHGPQSAGRTIDLMRQACLSLGEAHEAGLVHRDIKPSNLFLCTLGNEHDFLKVLDFGVVRVAESHDHSMTATGQITGTPASMAPELVQGNAAEATADIYSLGCVMYWLLVGRHVFEAPNLMAMLLQHSTKPPTPPTELNPAVPTELETIVLDCLEKDPGSRIPNAMELRDRLSAVKTYDQWSERDAATWWGEHMQQAEFEEDCGKMDAMAETHDCTTGNQNKTTAFDQTIPDRKSK